VIDSMDFFFNREDPSRVLAMMRMMQAHTQMNRGLLLCTVSDSTVTKAMEQELEMLADMVLKFEVHRMGNEFDTRMVIRKFRNSPENLAIISFKVTAEEGITPETVQRII
jgi:archaellum biogenesis ATPase FlaH